MVKQGSAVHSLASMSYEDLHRIFRLCGGNEADVVKVLAKLWNMEATAIAPLVRSWVAAATFPDPTPPSCQRSAPPVLAPPGMRGRLAASAAALGITPPSHAAISAPVYGMTGEPADLPSVLARLHDASSRLHEAAGRWRQHQERRPMAGVHNTRVQVLSLPRHEPTFVPVAPRPLEVPGARDGSGGDELMRNASDALAQFMAKQGPHYQHNSLLPTAGAAWNAMNRGSQRMPLGHEPSRQMLSVVVGGGAGSLPSVARRHELHLARR